MRDPIDTQANFYTPFVIEQTSRGERSYVAECWELAVVTQGSTLDEVVAALREALALHLDGEDYAALGLTRSPRLVVTYESALENGPPAPPTLG